MMNIYRNSMAVYLEGSSGMKEYIQCRIIRNVRTSNKDYQYNLNWSNC
jgi:hypothetical protein